MVLLWNFYFISSLQGSWNQEKNPETKQKTQATLIYQTTILIGFMKKILQLMYYKIENKPKFLLSCSPHVWSRMHQKSALFDAMSKFYSTFMKQNFPKPQTSYVTFIDVWDMSTKLFYL